jgi:hypothetical protein
VKLRITIYELFFNHRAKRDNYELRITSIVSRTCHPEEAVLAADEGSLQE